jgi:hypothetical protein
MRESVARLVVGRVVSFALLKVLKLYQQKQVATRGRKEVG